MWDMVACMLKNFLLLIILSSNTASFTITHVGFNHMYGGHNHFFQVFFTFNHVYVDFDCMLSFLCQIFVIRLNYGHMLKLILIWCIFMVVCLKWICTLYSSVFLSVNSFYGNNLLLCIICTSTNFNIDVMASVYRLKQMWHIWINMIDQV